MQIAVDPEGNILVTGFSLTFDNDGPEYTAQYVTVKYSSGGQELWVIAVERYSKRLHFLHAALGTDEEGFHSAHYYIHYADGTTNTMHVVYGEDIRDCMHDDKPLKDPSRSAVAWNGKTEKGQAVRLFKTTWDNPRPTIEISSIDFKSDRNATLFLVAITVEDADPPTWTVAVRQPGAP